MIPPPADGRREATAEITAILKFSSNGFLKAILLDAQTDGDESVLERALDRLISPGHRSWVKRLFKRS